MGKIKFILGLGSTILNLIKLTFNHYNIINGNRIIKEVKRPYKARYEIL